MMMRQLNHVKKIKTKLRTTAPAQSFRKRHLSASSTFQPPPNNIYHGEPVYSNIDITSSSSTSSEKASAQRNVDADAVFVVTGASRGIGLQFCKSLLERTSGTIVACARNPSTPALKELEQLSSASSRVLHRVPLDVQDQDAVDELARILETTYGRVDVLFNNAGILGDAGASSPGPERNLSQLNRDWFNTSMEVNAVAPMMLCQSLTPLMKSRKGKKESRAATVVVNMSARVGSIADNARGGLGWHSYRMSKAALNMGTRVIGHELKRQGTWAIALYPGLTDTDLSKPFQKGMKEGLIFPVDFTVGRLLDVVDNMEEEHSGGLYDWSGQALPF